jgi:LmbE family N-acetylglucosaminyl deacetylase
MPSSRMRRDSPRVAPAPTVEPPAAVVVAHPDDEALWLSSIVGAAGRVVFCFADPFGRPERAAARRLAVAALPLTDVVELGIPESGAGLSVDWAHPRPTPTGIAIVDPAAGERYEANYARLVESLRSALAGVRSVYTHNPWGEYGHAEHIQVHRAVEALQAELGYTVWFSNYVGKSSWPLARQLGGGACWSERKSLPPDLALARRLKRVYRRYGAWTWTIAHRWPARETLYAVPPAGDLQRRHALAGEGLLDVAGLRWWPPPWRSAHRRLR